MTDAGLEPGTIQTFTGKVVLEAQAHEPVVLDDGQETAVVKGPGVEAFDLGDRARATGVVDGDGRIRVGRYDGVIELDDDDPAIYCPKCGRTPHLVEHEDDADRYHCPDGHEFAVATDGGEPAKDDERERCARCTNPMPRAYDDGRLCPRCSEKRRAEEAAIERSMRATWVDDPAAGTYGDR